jgi:hypothetical protein
MAIGIGWSEADDDRGGRSLLMVNRRAGKSKVLHQQAQHHEDREGCLIE